MSAGNDPDLDAMFGDIPADSPQLDAAVPDENAALDADTKTTPETPAEPSRPERPRGPKKPWWDIYTSMLALTLVAILFGCIFLLMELSRYNFQTTPPAMPATPAAGG